MAVKTSNELYWRKAPFKVYRMGARKFKEFGGEKSKLRGSGFRTDRERGSREETSRGLRKPRR